MNSISIYLFEFLLLFFNTLIETYFQIPECFLINLILVLRIKRTQTLN
jgi:hypothetical protein